MSVSRLVNRNVVAERGRTSMRLEPELWDALLEICKRENQDVSTLVRRVEQANHAGGRTSAVRVFIVNYFRGAATEEGHAHAGHGYVAATQQRQTVCGFAEEPEPPILDPDRIVPFRNDHPLPFLMRRVDQA